MELEFTKGPWKFNGASQKGGNHFNVVGTTLGSKFKIARVPFDVVPDLEDLNKNNIAEAKANAKLIAAAPCLLSALQGLLKRYKELVDSGDCGCWKAEEEQEYIDGVNAINKALNGK